MIHGGVGFSGPDSRDEHISEHGDDNRVSRPGERTVYGAMAIRPAASGAAATNGQNGEHGHEDRVQQAQGEGQYGKCASVPTRKANCSETLHQQTDDHEIGRDECDQADGRDQ